MWYSDRKLPQTKKHPRATASPHAPTPGSRGPRPEGPFLPRAPRPSRRAFPRGLVPPLSLLERGGSGSQCGQLSPGPGPATCGARCPGAPGGQDRLSCGSRQGHWVTSRLPGGASRRDRGLCVRRVVATSAPAGLGLGHGSTRRPCPETPSTAGVGARVLRVAGGRVAMEEGSAWPGFTPRALGPRAAVGSRTISKVQMVRGSVRGHRGVQGLVVGGRRFRVQGDKARSAGPRTLGAQTRRARCGPPRVLPASFLFVCV